MSRQPEHIRAASAGGGLYGRRAIWAAIRDLGTFTLLDLRLKLPHVKAHAVKEYLASLVKAGLVSTGAMIKGPGLGCNKVRQYSLTRDTGVDAPRLRKDGTELPPTAQQHMWLAMKIIGAFTEESLAAAASTAEVPVPAGTAASYIRHLLAAGYLSERSGNGAPVYRLVNDTGGLAPMVQRTRVVFDPNTNSIVWHEEVEP